MKFQIYTFFYVFIFAFILLVPTSAQTIQEIEKLKNEYNQALKRQSLQKPSDIVKAEELAKSTALPEKLIYSRKDIESLLLSTQKLIDELSSVKDSVKKMPYVGYEIFTKRDSIPFWQNIPIPQNYILGPGDELVISMWGEMDRYDIVTINKDGQFYIDGIGILNLGEKSLDEAKKYLLLKYSKVHSTLTGNSPKSFIDISLGELKSINVHFVGYVNLPGVHTIHPFSNVIAGVSQAGGVDMHGSLRDIQLIRNNKKISSLDSYDYIFSGKSLTDLRLMDQDIIFVPPRTSTVAISGHVKKNGYFELKPGESLSRLLELAGGKSSKSSNTVYVFKRNDKNGDNVRIAKESDIHNIILSDGDSVHVPLGSFVESFVHIAGQVKAPGRYPYEKLMTLKELINLTMTFDDKDFLKTVDFSNIIISRKNKEGIIPKKIKINLETENPVLNNGDHITIGRTKYFKPIEAIKITGEVNVPGIYPVNNQSSLKKVLEMAGGFTDLALDNGIEIFRDTLKIAWENDSFILKKGDSLNVLERSGLVLVMGEVNHPGYISFKKGLSLKKYINKAGGFSTYADRRDIYIIKPNGVAEPYKKINSPIVSEGSIIKVNERKLSGNTGVTGWQAFSIVSSQVGNLASTLLTLALISSQVSNAQ